MKSYFTWSLYKVLTNLCLYLLHNLPCTSSSCCTTPPQLTIYLFQFYAGQLGASTETLLNALPSVDTFFFLSGTLVAYLSFIQLEKNQFNLIMFYVHRYIRLVPYITQNPKRLSFQGDHGSNQSWWWIKNFLFCSWVTILWLPFAFKLDHHYAKWSIHELM